MMNNFESDIEDDVVSENGEGLDEYTTAERVINYMENSNPNNSLERNNEIELLREIRNTYKPEEETTDGSDDGYLSGSDISNIRRLGMETLEKEREKALVLRKH